MPYKKRAYTKRKKPARRYRKMTIPRAMGNTPMPRKFATRMKYVENINLVNSSGLIDVHVFNAGGLFDPDTSATGHQPRGFDQIMPLYENYTVIGAKCTVKFSTGAAVNTIVGIALLQNSTLLNLNGYQENRWVRTGVITEGQRQHVLTMTYSPKMIGYSHPLSVDNLQGTISSLPQESSFFHVFSADAVETTSTGAVALVEIEYIAVFHDPVQPGQS